ncbi:hypothetical protein Acr_09g0002630 [Actinidia rufa]|uniref:Steroid nuclear receptor ligand-binding n=1 Tax=Actinidia rufa TaxID=165716 RepID=A0A7J0F7C0_9ERIC|nr:hypothetical protein Acr_09g0002630 [Actinidia rufa]
MDMPNTWEEWLKILYVGFAFCSALCLGALKSFLVGPIAGLILIIGNVGVILGLFPLHVAWTVYTLVKTNRFDAPLKVAFFFALPALFGIWLGLSIAGSVLVGVGYGFFTPWVSAFEAFRHENEFKKFFHCVVDGTWGTIKGSCTVVEDFLDMCYHSYPLYLKELRESPVSNELQPLRFIHVPGCIIVGLMGLLVEIPLYTAIAIVKSPYMLFKGWHRLIHDLISREGPFLETACIPIAGLTILMWPLFVVGSIVTAVFSSFFIGLYGSVIVYQERSFGSGVAYLIAMVAEFDEYTNDWLYLREGSILPKAPIPKEENLSIIRVYCWRKSVRDAIQEVKMVQVWGNMMRSCEMRGKELLDTKSGSDGLLLLDNFEINNLNRPQDRLLDWFFQPVMVLKEQIKVIELGEGEAFFLEKVVLFGSNNQRMEAWESGSLVPQDALRAAQIEGIGRRMMGMVRSVSKLPTYRRRFRQIVKALIIYHMEKEGSNRSIYLRSVASVEVVQENLQSASP